MSESHTTTDHDEIRSWAERHGGRPAAVASTGSGGDPGLLRIVFPEGPRSEDEDLEEVSWDEWLRAFDQNDLALVHEPDGRFNKLVSREHARS